MTRSAEVRQYPTSDDPVARFQAVVSRGKALQRRQNVVTGAGAGGALAASALAIGLVVRGGGSNDPAPATTVAPAPSISSTTQIRDAGSGVSIDTQLTGRKLAITVTDAHQPVLPGSQMCVVVDLESESGPGSVAEGTACEDHPTDADSTTVDLRSTNGTAIVCAATATRADESTTTVPPATRSVTHQFTTEVPTDVAPGHYRLKVQATSGVGDGCGPSVEGSTQFEQAAQVAGDVTVG